MGKLPLVAAEQDAGLKPEFFFPDMEENNQTLAT
jgi:hypothetical protein